MPTDHRAELKKIRSFPSLVRYLRDEMGWPMETLKFEDLTFEYTPEELGIDAKNAAKIEEIKRLRPLTTGQPWGIFFVKFERKRLPVVALRRILSQVAIKKRASANSVERTAWAADDLLFVSNYGEGEERQISFAHFSKSQDGHDLPTLKVLGWDNLDTALHLDAVAKELTEHLAWPDNDSDVEAWRQLWRGAFTLRHREVVSTSKELSIRLAELARAIHDRIKTALAIETERGPLTKLMKAFQGALVHDLDADGFADMYAQTIAYGLLSARIVDPHKKTADDLAAHMRTSPFLRELMETFLKVGGRRGKAGGPGIDFDELGVSEVVELLDHANMEAVVRDFGDRNRQEDPVIHFYELFLHSYNKQLKIQRGVFYTPQPVVSYIVRSVHELLQTEFGLADGLADTTTWGEMLKKHPGLKLPPLTDEPGETRTISPDEPFVQILDIATGTGTFIVEVIDVIHKTMVAKWKKAGKIAAQIDEAWNEYVPKHLLPRVYGFELMMAPYAIAHMKVGLKLWETGYRFGSEERARIYLTNTLEPWVKQLPLIGFDALAHEAAAVNEIKRHKRFTVVVGNPPYSIISANMSEWITDLCETYKVRVRLRERQIQALSDDYVKFLRLMEWQLQRSNCGVLGVITNNGFLDGHLFADLRSSLQHSFGDIRVTNLHGNSRTQERTPEGKSDENVFDIQTGVAITCGTRYLRAREPRLLSYDLWGTRTRKYEQLAVLSARTVEWRAISISSDSDPWIPVSSSDRSEWDAMVGLLDVFGSGNRTQDAQKRYAAGFVSQQDDFAIAFSRQEIEKRLELLLAPTTTENTLREQYKLCTTTQWNFKRAREELRRERVSSLLAECTYRPFDRRWTVFHRGIVSILRRELMRHLFHQKNVALLATRGISRQSFAHLFVTNEIVDRHALDNASESMFVFPLYVYPDASVEASAAGLFEVAQRSVNLSRNILSAFSANKRNSAPEDIFQYTYAVFHSPGYRSRYAEFLKADFPRLPLTGNLELFRGLARLGGELVSVHLLESPKVAQPITEFIGGRNPEVEKLSWSRNTVWVDKAQTAGFKGVRDDVWNFHIGGYQVCEKWLKDRKGRTLSKDDIAHYQRIVVALNETIRLMKEIDEVIEKHGGWPGAFAQANGETSGAESKTEKADNSTEIRRS